MQSRSGLCEDCLAKGIYTPAEIVHHVIPLTPENIKDPTIALSWSNLKAVCRECHAVEHGARQKRYKVDQNGRAVAVRYPPWVENDGSLVGDRAVGKSMNICERDGLFGSWS